MFKVKEKFLWFKEGDMLDDKEVQESWIVKGHVEPDKPKKGKKKKVKLDLNGDGKVDSKDASLASKVMNAVKKKKRSKKKK